MIRPVTCICFAMAVASGLYLYQAKDAAQVLDRSIEKTVRETEATRDQTRALRTEWTLRNEPDRLRQLAERYLPALQPVAPSQFANLSDIDGRLPAPKVNQPSEEAPLPEEGGQNNLDGTVGADAVIPQSGAPDDLPLPPLPPSPILQAGAAPPPAVPSPPVQAASTQPSSGQVQVPTTSAGPAQTAPRAVERSAAVTKPAVSVALVQPQGPRVPLPEPRPVAPRPADVRAAESRQTDTRSATAPVDLRTTEPARTPEPPRPTEARTAEARVVAPSRPVAPPRSVTAAVPSGPPAPLRAAAPGGSMLGMARDNAGGGAPPPLPIPRPVPVNTMPAQWPNGG